MKNNLGAYASMHSRDTGGKVVVFRHFKPGITQTTQKLLLRGKLADTFNQLPIAVLVLSDACTESGNNHIGIKRIKAVKSLRLYAAEFKAVKPPAGA
jgi:hypothetical protein